MVFPDEIQRCFPRRQPDSHKGTYGTLVTVCGSYGMAGAAILSAKAALRSGVGLLVCGLPSSIYPIGAAAVPEAVFAPLPETADGKVDVSAPAKLRPWLKKASALLIGCGMGTGDTVTQTVATLLCEAKIPLVLDADGINAAARHIPIRETGTAPLVMTPHPAEMARLLECTVEEVQRDREAAAVTAARQWHGIMVLKGHRTVVADESGVLYVNETGNPGMATAGSGDVLAGMVGAFLAQGMTAREAAVCAVYLHGASGDRMAARLSQRALMASDLIDGLPELFLQLEQQE
jgi:NAD(P)H-hydrate epimerase